MIKADPPAILLALAGTLTVGLLGIFVYVRGTTQRGTLAARSMLTRPEPWSARMVRVVGRALASTRAGRRLAMRLQSSGAPLTPLMFVGLCAVAFLSGTAITSLLFPAVLAALFGLVGVGACFAWLEHRRTQRRFAFVAQLPDVARLLSNGAQAGLSLAGAVQRAAGELDAPASEELAIVTQELRLGGSLDDALRRLRDRLPSREVAVLMSTLIIQQRAGGDTVRALQDMADTLDARKDTLREVRTLMAGAIATSYVVAIMGVAAIFLINLVSPGVLEKMTRSLLGIVSLAVAGILYITGFTLIRAITRIDV